VLRPPGLANYGCGNGDELIPFPKFFPSVPDLCKIFHEYQRASSQLFCNERLADRRARHEACLE